MNIDLSSKQAKFFLVSLAVMVVGLGTYFYLKPELDYTKSKAGGGLCQLDASVANRTVFEFPTPRQPGPGCTSFWEGKYGTDCLMVSNNENTGTSRQWPYDFSLSAGKYKVTLQAYDPHLEEKNKDSVPQPDERYYVYLGSDETGSGLIATTGASQDIPDNTNFVSTVVNEGLNVGSAVSKIGAVHAHTPLPDLVPTAGCNSGNGGCPNSLSAVCVAFDLIEDATTPTPTVVTPPPAAVLSLGAVPACANSAQEAMDAIDLSWTGESADGNWAVYLNDTYNDRTTLKGKAMLDPARSTDLNGFQEIGGQPFMMKLETTYWASVFNANYSKIDTGGGLFSNVVQFKVPACQAVTIAVPPPVVLNPTCTASGNISWTGAPRPDNTFTVRISTTAAIPNDDKLYRKTITVSAGQSSHSTTFPDGFLNYINNSALAMQDGTTYYVQVNNGVAGAIKSFVYTKPTCTTATPTPITTATPPPSLSCALGIEKLGENMTKQSPVQPRVDAAPLDLIRFTINVTSQSSTRINYVIVRDDLPSYVVYVPGSTYVAGSPALDGIATGGIAIGNLEPNTTKTITFQARVGSSPAFQSGTTVLANSAFAGSSCAAERESKIPIFVSKTVIVPVSGVKTGVDGVMVTSLVSLIVTFGYGLSAAGMSYFRKPSSAALVAVLLFVFASTLGVSQSLKNVQTASIEIKSPAIHNETGSFFGLIGGKKLLER